MKHTVESLKLAVGSRPIYVNSACALWKAGALDGKGRRCAEVAAVAFEMHPETARAIGKTAASDITKSRADEHAARVESSKEHHAAAAKADAEREASRAEKKAKRRKDGEARSKRNHDAAAAAAAASGRRAAEKHAARAAAKKKAVDEERAKLAAEDAEEPPATDPAPAAETVPGAVPAGVEVEVNVED